MSAKKQSKASVKVLVVGDWIIDENWLIAPYRSDTSSHVGREHFRSLVDSSSAQILGLCAAGSVARALHSLCRKQAEEMDDVKKTLEIYGLGLWNERDTKLLAALFSNNCLENETPLTLEGPRATESSESGDEYLCRKEGNAPLCAKENCEGGKDACSHLKTVSSPRDKPRVTSRCIRMYRISAEGAPEITSRVDWLPLKDPVITPEQWHSALNVLPKEGEIRHIVVSDHGHGAVQTDLIRKLVDKYGEASWYIRTKDPKAAWVELLGDKEIRLRMVGADFIPKRSETKKWFYGSEVSKDGLEELRRLGQLDAALGQERWVVSFHNDNSILALHQHAANSIADREIDVFSLVGREESEDEDLNVGRSGVVFASCIASLLECYEGSDGKSFGESLLKRAVAHGRRWSEQQATAFKRLKDRDVRLYAEPSKALHPVAQSGSHSELVAKNCGKYKDLIGRWDDAHTGLGMVSSELHLWRGYASVDGYVAVREDLRRDIGKLHQAIQDFIEMPKPRASLNCLLLGQPGSGKTSLVERLAGAFKMSPLFFNLAQLTSLDQVIDCFDAISSLQNQHEKRPVLAFFDEIDTKVANQSALPLFLSPISDGTYTRGSHKFRLAPLVWIFAGVKIGEEGDKKGKEEGKIPDFRSRINGPEIWLTESKRAALENLQESTGGGKQAAPEEQWKTEQVYTGVRLLKQEFLDVTEVSIDVLKFMHELNLGGQIRKYRKVIQQFKHIQNGKVGRSNIPDRENACVAELIDKATYDSIVKSQDGETFLLIVEKPE
jgi:hypothetical protein